MGFNHIKLYTNKSILHPIQAYKFAIMMLRTAYYRVRYGGLGRKIEIGRNFRVFGRLSVSGPGKVVIGDNVVMRGTVTPWTHDENAIIKIGNNCRLDGTKFGCVDEITIGDNCIVADECRIMDSDFHSIYPDKRDDKKFIKSCRVVIGDNVWITLRCIVLKGAVIGANSTVLPNSIVTGNISEWSICGGSPATVRKNIRPSNY
jgi:acetyltransferase-like isoleucine patch superfamily enzyme